MHKPVHFMVLSNRCMIKRWLLSFSGTLDDLVSSKALTAGSAGLSEAQVRVIMQQLLVAVEHCHRLGVALYNMRVPDSKILIEKQYAACSVACPTVLSNMLASSDES